MRSSPDTIPGTCTAGTRSCPCTITDGCDEGLLCISRRCLDTEGTRDEPSPPIRPPARPPSLELPDTSTAPDPSDGGASTSDSGS